MKSCNGCSPLPAADLMVAAYLLLRRHAKPVQQAVHASASAYVSCRLSRKLATIPDRMIEAGQVNPAQNQAGTGACMGAAGGHGIMIAANAVSLGNCSHGVIMVPHGRGMALTGIIDGAKKSITAINAVLTIFRMCLRIAGPLCPGTHTPSPE
jgi:hypothetical protein